jgi:Ca-activated chloride channel homolog
MPRALSLAAFFAAALLAALIAAPQRPALAQETGVFRVASNLVTVPVSVVGPSGVPVLDLDAADFRLEVEGRHRQVVSLGEPGQTPIHMALLLDVSGSVHRRLDFQKQAAASFLRMVLKPNDSVAVFSVGARPQLLQKRTSSLAAAIDTVESLKPTREMTAFYDTVVEAARYLAEHAPPGGRRVLVVLSDGEDNNSERFRRGDALRDLQRNDCLFYAINPSGAGILLNNAGMRGHQALQALAADAGAAFLPTSNEELERAFRQIAAELQAQYLLGFYAPEGGRSEFQRIQVRVPRLPDARIRARQGFFTPQAS